MVFSFVELTGRDGRRPGRRKRRLTVREHVASRTPPLNVNEILLNVVTPR